jgi:hypothetical protein
LGVAIVALIIGRTAAAGGHGGGGSSSSRMSSSHEHAGGHEAAEREARHETGHDREARHEGERDHHRWHRCLHEPCRVLPDPIADTDDPPPNAGDAWIQSQYGKHFGNPPRKRKHKSDAQLMRDISRAAYDRGPK